MYQKILVPLDGSELAECVLPHVEVLARGCQAKSVVFIRVVEPFHQPTGDYVMDPDQVKKIESEHKRAAEAYLKKISAKVSLAGASIKTEVSVRPGGRNSGGLCHQESSGSDRHRHPWALGGQQVGLGQRRRPHPPFRLHARFSWSGRRDASRAFDF